MPMPLQERTRLVLPTLILSGLLLLVGAGAGWYLHRAQAASTVTLKQNVIRVQATEELMLIAAQLQLALDLSAVARDEKALEPVTELNQRADNWIARADKLATTDQGHQYVRRISNGYSRFREKFNAQLDSPPDSEELPQSMTQMRTLLHDQILDPAREYQKFNRQRLTQSSAHSQTLADRMSRLLLLLGCSGAVAGLMAGFTVARRVQSRFNDNQRAMAHSEQLATLGRVAAALAHELRNPLTSMRIIVQAASGHDGEVTMDAKELSILENEIERLDDSIQTFLDYARPPHPDKRRCVLQTLVDQTTVLVQRRAAIVDVELRNELPRDPIEINVDAGQIKQVILNIMFNALEACPDGGVVTVRQRNDLESEGDVEFEIADTGRGLPQSLGDRIFDAFVSTKDTGTGLGLAICKRMIEDHNGTLTANDAVPVGTVFTIRLPKP